MYNNDRRDYGTDIAREPYMLIDRYGKVTQSEYTEAGARRCVGILEDHNKRAVDWALKSSIVLEPMTYRIVKVGQEAIQEWVLSYVRNGMCPRLYYLAEHDKDYVLNDLKGRLAFFPDVNIKPGRIFPVQEK